jgi:hypothetical protein
LRAAAKKSCQDLVLYQVHPRQGLARPKGGHGLEGRA